MRPAPPYLFTILHLHVKIHLNGRALAPAAAESYKSAAPVSGAALGCRIKVRLAVWCRNNLPTGDRWVPAQRLLATNFRHSREVCNPPPEQRLPMKNCRVILSTGPRTRQAGRYAFSSGNASCASSSSYSSEKWLSNSAASSSSRSSSSTSASSSSPFSFSTSKM